MVFRFLKLNIFLLSFFCFFGFANAQVLSDEFVTITTNPESPQPNQSVTVTIESSITDLNTYVISWYKNDNLVKSDTGATSYTFVTGDAGVTDTITVLVGDEYIKTINISPAKINLIWETNASTHPFYKGKTLSSYQSSVKVVAMPDIANVDPKNFIYTWKLDWKVLGNDSGAGKNVLYVDGISEIRDKLVTVNVESIDGTFQAQNSIYINWTEPSLLFYVDDSLLGVLYNKAIIGSLDLNQEEVSLRAYPFYFSKDGAITYDWKINGDSISKFTNNLVTFKRGDEAGSSRIDLGVNNTFRLMQAVSSGFNINYAGNNS